MKPASTISTAVSTCALVIIAGCAGRAPAPANPEEHTDGSQDPELSRLAGSCDSGNAGDCLILGKKLWDEGYGASTQQGDETAREALARACDAGLMEGCSLLGEMVFDGVGGPQDAEAARDLYVKACEADEPHGCFREGELMLGDDDETARARFEKSCQGGCPHGCAALAELLYTGEGGPEDEDRAIELWQGACQEGVPGACEALEEIEREQCNDDIKENASCDEP